VRRTCNSDNHANYTCLTGDETAEYVEEQEAKSFHHQTTKTIDELKILVGMVRSNPSLGSFHKDFLSEVPQGINKLEKVFENALGSKTSSSLQREIGYLDQLEIIQKSARPMMFWCFASVPFLLDQLHIAKTIGSEIVLLWGINFSGITQQNFMQGLFFIMSYYFLKYCWSFIHLRLTYPHKVCFKGISLIRGKHGEEIQLAEQTINLLDEIREYLSAYDILSAAQAIANHMRSSPDTLENDINLQINEVKQRTNEAFEKFTTHRRNLLITEFLSYNFMPLGILLGGSVYLYFQFRDAFP